jgi:predicted house-cleaning noncanonical NTP pyrophosphatase (MazG superfamily)
MEKLVRDEIPRIIKKNGESPVFWVARDMHEKLIFLLNKAVEEECEFDAALTKDERIEEAVDCAEVYDAIIDVT